MHLLPYWSHRVCSVLASSPLPCWNWWAHADITLSHGITEASGFAQPRHSGVGGHAPPPCSPFASLKPEGAPGPHRKCLLISWPCPGGQRGWHSWSPWTVTIGKTILGRLSPPEHSADSRPKHILSLPVTRPIYLSWSSSLRDPSQVCHIARSYRQALRKHRQGDNPLSLSLALKQLAVPPRKKLRHQPGALIFAMVTQGMPSDVLVWKPAGFTTAAP